jgi:sugar phosphate isomerase/epimerase
VREAAALNAGVLVLVVGGLPPGSKDLPAAREMVTDGIAALAPYAAEHGVRLAVEPLHPMFCADRAVVATLGQALDIADAIGAPDVGVCVDTYHVWWDPEVYQQIARAGDRIYAFQVCDFLVPIPADALLGRGHVGDGVVDIPALARAVAETGYRGFTEVEIFNQQVWDTPGDQTLRTLVARHQQYLADVR